MFLSEVKRVEGITLALKIHKPAFFSNYFPVSMVSDRILLNYIFLLCSRWKLTIESLQYLRHLDRILLV